MQPSIINEPAQTNVKKEVRVNIGEEADVLHNDDFL
jgi:hypothetical protein